MRDRRNLERLAAAPGRLAAALLLLPPAAVLAACGSSPSDPSSGGGHLSSGGSCAVSSSSAYFARARVIFVGTMLAGRSVSLGSGSVLVSPARVRVDRYLKGSGPGVVSVATAVTGPGIVGEDGIEPLAGQHWKIYASSRTMPYQTSICDGTTLTSS